MRRLTTFAQSVALAGALGMPSSAFALSCVDVMNMVSLNIPANIVVDTIRNAPSFETSEVECLRSKGAPVEVVNAASAKAGGGTTDAVTPAPTMPDPEPSMGFDTEETLGGSGELEFSGDLNQIGEEPDDAGGPGQLQDAIQSYRSGKPATAAQSLYGMLVDGQFPTHETKIQYYLAKSLSDMELHHSAQHYFMEVVRKGPNNPYFKYALPGLVSAAERTGNDYELLRIVAKIPPEAFPRQARNHLYYLMGRKLFSKGELTQSAEYFAQVSAKSPQYLQAKYYEGIINQQRGKLKSSVMAFREVISTQPEISRTDRAAQEMEDMKDLAYINVARIYFGLERFDNADTYYAMVERESTYWPESLFERAWTNFWKADLNLALGLLLTVESPYFSEREFIPEVQVLRALTFFNLCEYDDVERMLVNFEAEYTPMQAEVEGFLNQYKDSRDLWDQAYEAYFVTPHDQSTLNKAMFARVLRNRDLAALVDHLAMMDGEVEDIDSRSAQFRDTVGDHLKQIIETDRLQYKKRAGGELLREMLKQNENLKSLLVQSEIIRFEVVDAQRVDYEFMASNVNELESGDDRRVDFATSREIIYWPFNGEFWKDELGYYRYTEHGSCQ